MSRLEEIRARLEAATPGEWIVEGSEHRYGRQVCHLNEIGAVGPSLDVTCGTEASLSSATDDARFIASAPADTRALLAVVEAATHATDGRTDATLTASDIRVWAAHQGSGALRNWMLGIAAALAALEGTNE